MNYWSIFFLCICFLSNVLSYNPYDLNQLYTNVWLSGAAYCNKEQYNTMKLAGPASGFIYEQTLYDEKTDLQGYIGYIHSTKTIYITIRGSSSAKNWLDDFEIRLIPYNTFPECKCSVHRGFYNSALSVTNQTIETIQKLKQIYPSYSVVATGHSYGAATSQLLAMELVKAQIYVQIYNYGQPRIGDANYAAFVNTKIWNYFRTTHYKDIVPHLPPTKGFDYYHSCREIFEDFTGKLMECSNTNCEDPNCANQYKVYETNTDDHSYYLGHYLSCETSTITK
jgi:hypothetical protein